MGHSIVGDITLMGHWVMVQEVLCKLLVYQVGLILEQVTHQLQYLLEVFTPALLLITAHYIAGALTLTADLVPVTQQHNPLILRRGLTSALAEQH